MWTRSNLQISNFQHDGAPHHKEKTDSPSEPVNKTILCPSPGRSLDFKSIENLNESSKRRPQKLPVLIRQEWFAIIQDFAQKLMSSMPRLIVEVFIYGSKLCENQYLCNSQNLWPWLWPRTSLNSTKQSTNTIPPTTLQLVLQIRIKSCSLGFHQTQTHPSDCHLEKHDLSLHRTHFPLQSTMALSFTLLLLTLGTTRRGFWTPCV